MKNSLHYDSMVRRLRHFFQTKKGFIEVPAQSRTSILAACENPKSITKYTIGGNVFPLPQTGQMWLETELLNNPTWPGVFCITTSYRDEQTPIEGRHDRVFPMFEFESHGTFNDLKKLEEELLMFLGFDAPIAINYTDAAQAYETEIIEAVHETSMAAKYGASISLEKFPAHTNPFWNMRSVDDIIYEKIDILLHGMETIGSAEREIDPQRMYERFFTLENGEYGNVLFTKFGKDRVLKELDIYLALPMFKRFGGGIGLTRLERAMKLSGLLEEQHLFYPQAQRSTEHML
jgi:aspartyl/asparaginyl-tRNA synthetase